MSKLFVFKLLFMLFLFLQKIEYIQSYRSNNFTYMIRGGYRPDQKQYEKYLVSIRTRHSSPNFGSNHFCTGAIIAPRLILSASHCFVHAKGDVRDAADIVVVAGAPYRLLETEGTQIIRVDEIKRHMDYTRAGVVNDIAVLKLAHDIEINNINTAIIPVTNRQPDEGVVCTVAGWGRIYNQGPLVNEALYVNLPLKKCFYAKNNNDDVLCSRDIDAGLGNSDSGGPLFCEDSVAGISSYTVNVFGYDLEDVFTNVWKFRDWLAENDATTTHKRNFMAISTCTIWYLTLIYFTHL